MEQEAQSTTQEPLVEASTPIEQVQTPRTPETSEKPMPKPALIVGTLSIIALLATTAFLGYQNWLLTQKISEIEKQTQAPSPTSTPDLYREPNGSATTADWKTYTDIPYKYSIKYPPSWTVKATPTEGIGGVTTLAGPGSNENEILIEIGKHVNQALKEGETLKDFEIRIVETDPSVIIKEEYVKIGDLSTLRQVILLSAGTKKYGIYYLFANKENVHFAEAYVDDYKAELNFVDQILSTFRSLNTSTSTVESYTACSCGCCVGGPEPEVKCIYKSKGDDLNKIIEEDKKARNASYCPYVGCSFGITYKYCD